MSWLSEIAGKAEDLLNKVDKTTAVVLQNKQSNIPPSSVNYNLNPSGSVVGNVGFRSASFNSKSYGSSYASVPSSKQSSTDKVYRKNGNFKRGPVSDDEKLLEYLNSSEPALPELRKKSLQKKEARNSDNSEGINNPSHTKLTITEMDTKISGDEVNKTMSVNPHAHLEAIESGSGKDTVMQIGSDCEESPTSEILFTNDEDELARQENPESSVQTNYSESYDSRLSGTEFQYTRKAYENQSLHALGDDRNARELSERESDLIAALDAKDSQLAVLKVRLEEADEEIRNKTNILEELKLENERLLRDYNEGLTSHSQVIENLKQQLSDAEVELRRTKEDLHIAQNEHLSQMNKVDEEKRQLAENITVLQKKISELSDRNRESALRLSNANRNLESLQHEYNDYKQRAQRILQSKEKLISSLKDGHLGDTQVPCSETNYAMLSAETEGIKQERDLLREELKKAMDSIETYRAEMHELEKMAQNDADAAREHCRNLEEQLHQERILKDEVQHLNNQLKEEISFLQEEITRTKSSFNSRIEDREMEIEKLRKQLMAKSLSTVSQDELESRLHALTENLIQKQTMVEALSTEKNSLILQLERLEQQLKEAQTYGIQHHAVIGVSNNESERKPKASLFNENPLDSNLTRNVKRVYGSIDAFSIRLGVFFRRYPVARLFVFIYMLILHIWVMIVLLTYQPEIHGTSYKPNGKK